jgi:hypothetical protein
MLHQHFWDAGRRKNAVTVSQSRHNTWRDLFRSTRCQRRSLNCTIAAIDTFGKCGENWGDREVRYCKC